MDNGDAASPNRSHRRALPLAGCFSGEKLIVRVDATSDPSSNGALLEAAVADAENAGKILQLNAGIYRITSTLYLLPGMELVGTNQTVDVDGDDVPDEISSNVFVRAQTETIIDGSAITSNPSPGSFTDCLSPPHVWPLPASGPVVAAGRDNRVARVTVQGSPGASLLVTFHFDNTLASGGGWRGTVEDTVLREGFNSFFFNAGCGAVGFDSSVQFNRNVVYGQPLGLAFINYMTANSAALGSTLRATMRNNRIRGAAGSGVFIAGGRGNAQNSETIVESSGNIFENNGVGYSMSGGDFLGNALSPTHVDQLSRGSSARLTSNSDTFRANQTGVYVRGGNMGSIVVPDASLLSNNLARADLIGTTFADNVVDDIRVHGGVGMTEDNVAQLLLRHPKGSGKLTIAHSTNTSSTNTASIVGNPNSWAATTGWIVPNIEFFSSAH